MKRLCLTCKNKGCRHLCRFQVVPKSQPQIVQIAKG